jgi:hypothetical protein
MIVRGDRNPFLRGKVSKGHIKAFFSETSNPFKGLSEADRTRAISEFANAHATNFATSLLRLKEICTNCNFLQLLTHFGYYDRLLLDSDKPEAKYKPIEQHGAELLQALILQVPEEDLRLQLDSRPSPELLLEANKLLGSINTSFSLKRYASPVNEKKFARLLSEMIRGHTSGVRNEGFPSQIRRTMMELTESLDSVFEARRGVKLTLLATMLWNVAELIGSRLNADFAHRMKVFRSKTPDEMVSKFLQLHCPDGDLASEFRENVERAQLSRSDLRGYLLDLWDRTNFRLFTLSLDDWVSAYPNPAGVPEVEWALSMWSLKLGELGSADAEHFFLDNPVWARPIIRLDRTIFSSPFLRWFRALACKCWSLSSKQRLIFGKISRKDKSEVSGAIRSGDFWERGAFG